ncbi:GAF domain-containing sensor histidine kinase [Nocardioides sp. HDW12B]|uniref:sensor histidine kinase n=1 Tax=Nocardioides sp. HDW12B TaxID=2714939 RepID=UPI001409967B|nr:GAF domain-containing sensor histidine kinase [Nocardioides sp. HDW12B]QIK67253.1 GAF domain-containing sensor histidine kinase [Nocardioides sp. HDW12B]
MCTRNSTGVDTVIEQYGVLGEPAGRDLEALVHLAAQVCGVSHAAINLLTETEQHQVATAGFDASVCSREDSMCAAVLHDPRVVMVADASRDDRFRDNPFVTGEIGDVRFYASAGLTTPQGVVIGRLCVFDDEPRVLDDEQRELLTSLAERVVDALELRLRSRQLEESLARLTRTQEELHRSNEKLTLFAGQISHDLRTPLTALLANVEMLSEEPAVTDDALLGTLASGAMRAGRRMAAMIEDIHAHALLGADLRPVPVDLGEVVADVLRDLRPAVEDAGAHVEVGPLPVVCGDPQQLYAVLLNVLSNALKFRRPGVAPVVEVRAHAEGRGHRVEVLDNGPGVAVEERGRVFDLYARVDPETPGSGIGLATARRIVENHGGEIGLEAADGGGTLAWFSLPR